MLGGSSDFTVVYPSRQWDLLHKQPDPGCVLSSSCTFLLLWVAGWFITLGLLVVNAGGSSHRGSNLVSTVSSKNLLAGKRKMRGKSVVGPDGIFKLEVGLSRWGVRHLPTVLANRQAKERRRKPKETCERWCLTLHLAWRGSWKIYLVIISGCIVFIQRWRVEICTGNCLLVFGIVDAFCIPQVGNGSAQHSHQFVSTCLSFLLITSHPGFCWPPILLVPSPHQDDGYQHVWLILKGNGAHTRCPCSCSIRIRVLDWKGFRAGPTSTWGSLSCSAWRCWKNTKDGS